jgi:hypothetical protein
MNRNESSYIQAPYKSISILKAELGQGYVDGPMETAQFNQLSQIKSETQGNLLLLDKGNQRIRKWIQQSNTVITLAGTGQTGRQDGVGLNASFTNLKRMTSDGQDGLYIIDNNWIRKVDFNGNVSSIVSAPPNHEFRDLTFSNGILYIVANEFKSSKIYTFNDTLELLPFDDLQTNQVSIFSTRERVYLSFNSVFYYITTDGITKLFGLEGLTTSMDGPLPLATTCTAIDVAESLNKYYFISQCENELFLRVVESDSVSTITKVKQERSVASIAMHESIIYYLENDQILQIDF